MSPLRHLARLRAPRVGRRAPAFALPTLDGADGVGLTHLLAADRPVLLLFLDGESLTGRALVRRAARWQREHGGELTVAVLASRAGWRRIAGLAEAADVATLLLDHDGAAAHAYRALRLPAAALVDRSGRLAAPLATGPDAIELLVDAALDRPLGTLGWAAGAPLLGPAIGSRAPSVVVRDEHGAAVPLSDVLDGDPAVLLVWDRDCPACAIACTQLLAWPDDAPRLVAVAPAADDRLPAPVLVDAAGRVAAELGTTAPAAVLVDGSGRIAAPLARGGDAILTLARPTALV